MKTARLALIPALLIGLVIAGCGGDSTSVPADAVAVVDGTTVTRVSLDELLGRARKNYESQKRAFPKAGTAEYQQLQQQAVAFLVREVEYKKEAESLGVTITKERVDKRVAEVLKQYFGNSQKKLETQLKAQGYTPAAFRHDIETQLLTEALFAKLTVDVKVADKDLEKYYADNKSQYEVAESRKVRHILVKTKALADKLVAQLNDGGDFAALAKKHSLDTGSKADGGTLTISRGQTVPAFDKKSFELKVQQISEPVKTQFGFHIIQALGKTIAGSTTPFEKAKTAIKKTLLDERKQAVVAKWTDDAQKRYAARVSYSAGFAPPAEATASTAASKEK